MLTSDLRYRRGDSRGLLDLYRPESSSRVPFVVAIHGGAWREGDKERMGEYAGILVGLGIACVAPNYRLSGTDHHPAQQDDVFAALDWVAERADEYGLDTGRVGITGTSAGGHLTALVGLKATAPGSARKYTVRCMLPVCGVHDLVWRAEQRPDRATVLEQLIGGTLADHREEYLDASPIAHVHPAAPPCLATHGERDEVVSPEQSRRLGRALREVGVAAEAVIVPGAGHGRNQPGTDPPEPLGGRKLFEDFFRRHLCD